MKKMAKKVILPTLIAMAITGTTYAASFTDVPAKHWAYASVTKLANAGLVDGYGDGTFRGDKTITRYEMAVIVGKAIDRFDKADAAQQKEIDKLSAEFASELNRMGVRVATLEAKTNIKITGETRLRFMGNDRAASKVKTSDQFDFRQRIGFEGPINDSVYFKGRINVNNEKMGANTTTAAGSDVRLDIMNVTAKHVLGMDSIRAGRSALDFFSAGLIGKPFNVDGLTISNKFGNTAFKAWTGVVKPSAGTSNTDNHFTTATLGWKLTDKLNFTAGYYTADMSGSGLAKTQNITSGLKYESSNGYLASFGYKMGGLTLLGDYIGTTLNDRSSTIAGVNLPKNPKAWAVEITNASKPPAMYPCVWLVSPAKPGTDAWAISYRNTDPGAIPAGTANYDTTGVATPGTGGIFPNGTDNLKVLMLTYNRTIAKNVIWAVEYQDYKAKNFALAPTTWTKSNVDKTYNTSINFFY